MFRITYLHLTSIVYCILSFPEADHIHIHIHIYIHTYIHMRMCRFNIGCKILDGPSGERGVRIANVKQNGQAYQSGR